VMSRFCSFHHAVTMVASVSCYGDHSVARVASGIDGISFLADFILIFVYIFAIFNLRIIVCQTFIM